MDLSIIIVNYKTKKKALNCIKAIKASHLTGIAYEIILVDNASGDGSGEAVKEIYDDVVFIKSEKNLGMGGGNNVGIAAARGGIVLILNPDAYVSYEAIIKMYFHILSDRKIGVVAPKLLGPDKKIQPTCLRFPKFYTPLLRRTFLGRIFRQKHDDFLMVDFDHKNIRAVDWVQGSCLMIRKEVLEKIGGGFDEGFFMYFEDTDLCRRVWRTGYKVIYDPDAVVIHDHGRASAEGKWYLAPFLNRMARIHIRSWARYFWKWRKIKTAVKN